jgi:hypothetical protein
VGAGTKWLDYRNIPPGVACSAATPRFRFFASAAGLTADLRRELEEKDMKQPLVSTLAAPRGNCTV